jgi:3'-phosphoadenosine 5'-phosphosulfate sulfotransferase (PAPS reductase)/FAD synthetase
METPERVVLFSAGRGSWAAAVLDAQRHGTERTVLLFSDVRGEDADTYRFLEDAAADVGAPLVRLQDGRDIWQVFRDRKFLGNTRVANCSVELKVKPARAWLAEHADPERTTLVVGIDWTESHRLDAIRRAWAPFPVEAPLCDPPYLDRDAVDAMMRERGLRRPRLYDEGFAHGNCAGGCVKAGQGQFVHLLRQRPQVFAEWEQQEQNLREHLGKPVAILRDRRGGVTRPMTLRELRHREASAPEQLDLMDLGGCGCFVDGDV